MALSREQAEGMLKRCLSARKYDNEVDSNPAAFPMPAWAIDAVVLASGGRVDEPCYPGGQLIEDATITKEDGRAAE